MRAGLRLLIVLWIAVWSLLLPQPSSARVRRPVRLASFAASRPVRLPPAPASPVQRFSIVNTAGVAASDLFHEERAIEERSHALRALWHTPLATFGPGGIPVTILPGPDPDRAETGHHSFCNLTDCAPLPTGVFAVVYTDGRGVNGWGLVFSHEVFETLVDPSELGPEVCDPPGQPHVWAFGVPTSGFVGPAYFAIPPEL